MALSTHAPHAPMTDQLRNFARAVVTPVGAFFATVNRAMVINSTAYEKLGQVERLRAKSDAELAELGIERENIVQHVFRGFI